MATKQEIREYFAKFGRKGGKLAASRMSPEERREKMRRAAQARWAKAKKKADKDQPSLDEIARVHRETHPRGK